MGLQLTISGVVLNDIGRGELASKIEDFDYFMAMYREKLMMLAAASPREIIDANGGKTDWIDYCQSEVKQILDELLENAVRRHLAVVALANPEDVVESY